MISSSHHVGFSVVQCNAITHLSCSLLDCPPQSANVLHLYSCVHLFVVGTESAVGFSVFFVSDDPFDRIDPSFSFTSGFGDSANYRNAMPRNRSTEMVGGIPRERTWSISILGGMRVKIV